ncbi:KIN11 [Symbiodinium pilosum]|uniref:KIN11 protein n=1 Tax=Symbiodinium pilosum TaxID=2952 RepID=A0A812STZ0_SYMPI|nr:KIN11 [Symbiodinium pilosum]
MSKEIFRQPAAEQSGFLQVSTPATSGRTGVTRPSSLRGTQGSGSDVVRDIQMSPPTSGRVGVSTPSSTRASVTRPGSARTGASPQDIIRDPQVWGPSFARVAVSNSPTPCIVSSSGGVAAHYVVAYPYPSHHARYVKVLRPMVLLGRLNRIA